MFPREPAVKPIVGRQAWEDEYTTCKAWDRPARQNHTDRPYYPWMPPAPPEFRVSFKLGFQ